MSDGDFQCHRHGHVESAVACIHILESLEDGVPRGFVWDVCEGVQQAVCSACDAMPDDEWIPRKMELGCAICVECFKNAAELNGVDLRTKAN